VLASLSVYFWRSLPPPVLSLPFSLPQQTATSIFCLRVAHPQAILNPGSLFTWFTHRRRNPTERDAAERVLPRTDAQLQEATLSVPPSGIHVALRASKPWPPLLPLQSAP
jgi:hypothetical protein